MSPLKIHLLIPGETTSGSLSVFEEIVPPGSGPPLHAHRTQIEIFHIIEGHFQFRIGDSLRTLTQGDAAVVRADVPHAFRNVGAKPGRLHFELLPSNRSEEFFERLVAEGETIEDLQAFFDAYDTDLLGPPLGGEDNP